MIEAAQKKVKELGIEKSLSRDYAKLDDIINKKFESQEELLSLRQRQKEITNLLTDNNNGVVLEENEAEEIELEI